MTPDRATIDALYDLIKERALADDDPKILALFQRVPVLEVSKTIERIKIDYATQPGVLAAMIAEGFFGTPMRPAEIVGELKRRGRAVHPPNLARDLGRLTELGFLTKEGDGGYQAVPEMRINIVEATA